MDVCHRPAAVDGVSAAVLAGGKSRRFGQDKAQVMLGGRPLLGYVLDPLQRLFEDVKIIAGKPEKYECFEVDVASDVLPGAGALGGILTALVHSRFDRCFVVACDMPFLNEGAIRKMFDRYRGYDVLVPFCREEPQPLHACYSRKCIPFISKKIQQGDFRIIDFYVDVFVRRIGEDVWRESDPECLSFFNVNTPGEFEEAERRLHEKVGR